jgi:hypothetical protein
MIEFFKYFRLLHYFNYNQNLFLFSTILFCLFILIVLIIYIYLILLSFNGKNIEYKKFCLGTLRFSMGIISTILIIPLQGKMYYN